MTFFSDFYLYEKENTSRHDELGQNITSCGFATVFFCFHFVSLSDINNWESFLQICFFLQQISPAVN